MVTNLPFLVHLVTLWIALIHCSVDNDEKENEISVDSVVKTSKSGGHCSSDDCFELKPIQIYVPYSPLIPCDKV